MPWAVDESGNKVSLAKGAKATCSVCEGSLRAHCGEVLINHWHHDGKDCDPWHEPETEWHQQWKSYFPEDWREFPIVNPKGNHRADILTIPRRSKFVVEFQHSSLSPEEIREREKFWVNIVWVFDAREWFHNLDIRIQKKKITFRWKHPRKSMFHITKPLFLDTGDEIFEVTFLGKDIPCGGSGRFIGYKPFRKHLIWSDYTSFVDKSPNSRHDQYLSRSALQS